MFNWVELTVKQEQQKDFLRQAEHHRLVKEALKGQRRSQRHRAGLARWLAGITTQATPSGPSPGH